MLHLVLLIDVIVALICSGSKVRIFIQGGMELLKHTIMKVKTLFDCWVVKAVLLVLDRWLTPSPS